MPRSSWIFLLLLVWGAATSATLSGETLTLSQAVEAALGHGADQVILDANLKSARAVYAQAQAKTGFTLTSSFQYNASEAVNDPVKALDPFHDPLVSSVGSGTKDGVLPQNVQAGVTLATPLTSVAVKGTQNFQFAADGTLNQTTQGSATVNQVLWNGYAGGPAQATADKASLSLQVAELNAQANKNKLILSVKQAFFTLVSAQESMAQLDLTLAQRNETLKFVQAKASLNQATGLDLKTAQINARSAQLDRDAGQSALDVARRRLANLMGRPDTDVFTAALEPDPTVAAGSLEDAIQTALKNRVEPQVARANARSAAIDAQLAAGATTPSLNLTGGLNYSRDWQTSQVTYVGVLGVSLGLPLVDSGAAANQGNQAAAAASVAQTQEQQLLHSIPVDVTEAWNTWKVNQQRYEVSALAVEVATGQRQVLQAQFEAGLKNLSDVQTSDVALSTAQFNLLKAKITSQLSALQLQNLLGL